MSLTKLSLAGNIPAGEGKIANLFYSVPILKAGTK
jgi:hypothetical protein